MNSINFNVEFEVTIWGNVEVFVAEGMVFETCEESTNYFGHEIEVDELLYVDSNGDYENLEDFLKEAGVYEEVLEAAIATTEAKYLAGFLA